MNSDMPAERQLEVRDLSIEFQSDGRYCATVSGISFHLDKGSLLALVGESGCGKSVSCLALARLLPSPQGRIASGEILLRRGDGRVQDVRTLPEKELRKIRGGEIAYIFQEPGMSLNPVFRIGNQIMEAIRLHCPDIADPRAEAVELLRQVGIPDPEDRVTRYPHELSGGMQQRVMIAMALASRPSILVADEPTTALDVTIQAQILDLISRLRKDRNMSVILVTHNLGIVAQLADHVAVMYAGTIVETAETEELLRHPRHPYAAALIAAVPVLNGPAGRLQTIPGTVPPPERFGTGCRFYDRCPHAVSLPEEVREKCRSCRPPLEKIGEGHFCACHAPLGKEGDSVP